MKIFVKALKGLRAFIVPSQDSMSTESPSISCDDTSQYMLLIERWAAIRENFRLVTYLPSREQVSDDDFDRAASSFLNIEDADILEKIASSEAKYQKIDKSLRKTYHEIELVHSGLACLLGVQNQRDKDIVNQVCQVFAAYPIFFLSPFANSLLLSRFLKHLKKNDKQLFLDFKNINAYWHGVDDSVKGKYISLVRRRDNKQGGKLWNFLYTNINIAQFYFDELAIIEYLAALYYSFAAKDLFADSSVRKVVLDLYSMDADEIESYIESKTLPLRVNSDGEKMYLAVKFFTLPQARSAQSHYFIELLGAKKFSRKKFGIYFDVYSEVESFFVNASFRIKALATEAQTKRAIAPVSAASIYSTQSKVTKVKVCDDEAVGVKKQKIAHHTDGDALARSGARY